METVIKICNISKQYRLGEVGTGSLSHDINRWWHKVLGKEDPYLKIGDINDRTKKSFSDYVWALKDINCEVKKGEVIGIIGKNGAGKSTLLKILSRTTVPTLGSVKIKGRVASLLEVGTGFHPELSGKENIFLNGAILGMTKNEINRKFDEIVDFAGVDKYVDTPVKRYSSGMYVRLAFAVAAYLEPEILIVDEVLAVGDADFQKKAIGKMKDVSYKEGRTVLFVSHNMTAIKSLCTSGILMQHGTVIKQGDIASIINAYTNHEQTILQHIEWPSNDLNAGSSRFKMNSIKILPKYNNGHSKIYTNTAIDIVFESQILNEHVLIDFQLRSLDDEIIFHIDSEDKILNPGHHKAYCRIPANLLNDGKYKIAGIQIVTQHSRLEHRYYEELFFEVEDYRENAYWHGKWPGFVRPIGIIEFPIY